ncbi:MAG: NAD-glutamate dehydrogenase [Desulfuromonadales bacterium]|nr:NAD-glutamate dehydrogenase [Desulfuromonadales bacterium]
MKVVVTSHDRMSVRDDFAEKVDQTIALLKQADDKEPHDLLVRFVDLLAEATPSHYLTQQTPQQIASLTRQFYKLIALRCTDVAVHCLKVEESGGVFLLSNSADAPFLIHSIQLCLNRLHVHFRVVTHPILHFERKKGEIVSINDATENSPAESFIVIELEGRAVAECEEVKEKVRGVIEKVLKVAAAQKLIAARIDAVAALNVCASYRDFFSWLQNGNINLFACQTVKIDPASSGKPRQVILLQEQSGGLLDLFPDQISSTHDLEENPFLSAILDRTDAIGIEILDKKSPILRDERLIYLGIRETLADGSLIEHGFIGLQTEQALLEASFNVLALRHKFELALKRLRIPVDSYDYRKVLSILNAYPKIDLFFMDQETLVHTVRTFALMQRHGAVRVIPAFGLAIRGLTLVIIMPKRFFTDQILQRIEFFFCRYFLVSDLTTRVIPLSNDYLTLHINLFPQSEEVVINIDRIERSLTHIAEPWDEKLHKLMDRSYGEQEGAELLKKYHDAFSQDYQNLIHPRFAVRDIQNLEEVLTNGEERVDLWGPFTGKVDFYRLQFYSIRESYLNDLMPFLENLNLSVIEEIDFEILTASGVVYIKSFSVLNRDDHALKLSSIRENLLETLQALRRRKVENDYLNRLMVLTGLTWKQIDIFRGYRNYYFQIGCPFTKRRVAFSLINNPRVTLLLYRYFEARFAPNPNWADILDREEHGMMPIRLELAELLESVSDINEDKILRTFFNLIDSTVRTNFFQRQFSDDYFFSFKISALGIIDMPAPRPLYEVAVHSAMMEGIHLRGGLVARGGIRWSDRPDDYRTEILGLIKTQMTKNALIVPVGSKGGFVVKTPYTSREEGAALSKAAYQILMRGLLDLTDNRIGGEIVPAAGLITYDDSDPYLVVAADKGTAHLPDTANAVSAEYNFWLGDAFASGGSQGYDHKRLGITARGAWISVQRHFREMGIDIQTQPFTVVGIGDMSGDVFGNGMLLSDQIRLRAAFDHRHIFIDPAPDALASFQERKRLFALPRSSWGDYDCSLISEGGGVWSRTDKEIPLSEPVREWLGVRHKSLDANSLIRLLLAAEVDLLWNGGIGTYIKASTETNESVGDRTNDPLRLDATEIRARVIGEGGNLGLTQLGRIEYALAGGRINTDAIDNSAGVDCSDHEVNLKILMRRLMEAGVVASTDERDRLLLNVTDDVCHAVLENNRTQTLCLALDNLRCQDDVAPFLFLSERLVRAGLLDRRGEFIPSSREVHSRTPASLVHPELAILLAYSKMHLYQAMLNSQLPDEPGAVTFLHNYFPEKIREQFSGQLQSHPLAREIIATLMNNIVTDQTGSTFVVSAVEKTGATPSDVVRTYLIFDAALDAGRLRSVITALDNKMPADQQYRLLLQLEQILATLVVGSLSEGGQHLLNDTSIQQQRVALQQYFSALSGVVDPREWQLCTEERERLIVAGLPNDEARLFSILDYLHDYLPISYLMEKHAQDVFSISRTYREVRNIIGLNTVMTGLMSMPTRDHWDRLALQTLVTRFQKMFLRLVQFVCGESNCNPESYFSARRAEFKKWQSLHDELSHEAPINLNPYTVLAELLESILEKSD